MFYSCSLSFWLSIKNTNEGEKVEAVVSEVSYHLTRRRNHYDRNLKVDYNFQNHDYKYRTLQTSIFDLFANFQEGQQITVSVTPDLPDDPFFVGNSWWWLGVILGWGLLSLFLGLILVFLGLVFIKIYKKF